MSTLTLRNKTYISVFPQFQGRVEYIEEHHPDMPVYCIDNNHNNGGKRVSNEEAKQWGNQVLYVVE